MRQTIIDYINTLSLGSIILSQELPWEDSGAPLYLKNVKRIYVDNTVYSKEPLIQTFDRSIDSDISTVRLYFSADAKQLPSNYDSVISDLRSVNDINLTDGTYRREVGVSTNFENDLLVTELEYRFTKLTT